MSLSVFKKDGIPVLTTSQLAEVLGIDNKSLNRSFQRNPQLYQPSKHYFSVSGEELRTFKNQSNDSSLRFHSILYLWTLDGCLMLASTIRSSCENKIRKIAQIFKVDNEVLIVRNSTYKEYEFGKLLSSVIPADMQLFSQYSILNYRLDFYIPEVKLAIEFDEPHHNHQEIEDIKRESNILREDPDIEFLRVKSSDIYSGLREVTSYFYNSKLGGR